MSSIYEANKLYLSAVRSYSTLYNTILGGNLHREMLAKILRGYRLPRLFSVNHLYAHDASGQFAPRLSRRPLHLRNLFRKVPHNELRFSFYTTYIGTRRRQL